MRNHFLLTFALVTCSAVCVARADDWPQWLGPKRDGVWREEGLLQAFPKQGLKVRWRAPVAAGYSSPAVAGGRVFVTDRVPNANAKKPSDPFQRVTQQLGHGCHHPGNQRREVVIIQNRNRRLRKNATSIEFC